MFYIYMVRHGFTVVVVMCQTVGLGWERYFLEFNKPQCAIFTLVQVKHFHMFTFMLHWSAETNTRLLQAVHFQSSLHALL